jgi:single-stranded DNA-binding protein
MPTIIKSTTANAVFFEGALVHNPELAYAPEGSAVASLLLSAEFTETDLRSGEINSVTLRVKAVCSGSLAETVSRGLQKGDLVSISGRLVPAQDWPDERRQPQGGNTIRITTIQRAEALSVESDPARPAA